MWHDKNTQYRSCIIYEIFSDQRTYTKVSKTFPWWLTDVDPGLGPESLKDKGWLG